MPVFACPACRQIIAAEVAPGSAVSCPYCRQVVTVPADNLGVLPTQVGYAPYPIQPNQGLAIASMILGILGVLLCGAFTAIPGLITGIMALNRISSNPQQYGGRGMAIAGVVTSVFSLILTVVVILIMIAR